MNYYPFHLGDYAIHTAHLEPMEDLAYRRMIDLYYLREEPLPSDPAEVARLVRMRQFQADVESVLREFFVLDDSGWRHARCDAEISVFQGKRSKAKASAQASVNARKNKSPNERSTNAQRTFNQPEPEPEPKEELEGSQRIAEPRPKAARGTRLPENWSPDPELWEWVKRERPDLDAEQLCEKFRDFWHGVPGQRGTKLDWPATFRNFARSERLPSGYARASPPTAKPWEGAI